MSPRLLPLLVGSSLSLVLVACGDDGDSGSSEHAHGACRRSVPGAIELCGDEDAVGSGAEEYVDAMRKSCEEDGQTWMDACDPTGALGACKAVQNPGATTAVTTVYVYPVDKMYETPEDVQKLCENTGLEYVSL